MSQGQKCALVKTKEHIAEMNDTDLRLLDDMLTTNEISQQSCMWVLELATDVPHFIRIYKDDIQIDVIAIPERIPDGKVVFRVLYWRNKGELKRLKDIGTGPLDFTRFVQHGLNDKKGIMIYRFPPYVQRQICEGENPTDIVKRMITERQTIVHLWKERGFPDGILDMILQYLMGGGETEFYQFKTLCRRFSSFEPQLKGGKKSYKRKNKRKNKTHRKNRVTSV